ncbi:MAG: hypothetical protein ABIO40_00305 [Devosia sp.]
MAQAPGGLTSRKLGEQERLFHYLHGFGGLIAIQVLHIVGPVDPDLLREALDWLQSQHPILNSHIEYGWPVFRHLPPFVYRQPYFVTEGTEPIPLRVVTNPAPDAWKREFERELGRPLARGRSPRLRAVLVRASEGADACQIFLTADHAIADARSTNMASRDLLAFLADKAKVAVRQGAQLSLSPELETRLPKQRDAGKSCTRIKGVPARKRGGRWRTGLAEYHFDADKAAAIKLAIRAERTTVHGAVSAAFLGAFRERYGRDELSLISSVDLRRLCKPPFGPEIFGCYIDLVRTSHTIAGELWANARDISLRLVAALAKGRESASLMKLPGGAFYRHDALSAVLNKRRIDALAVTTAGESGLARDYGRLRLEGVTMAVSTVMFGTALFVICSERLGGLDLYAGYSEDALEPAEAEWLTQRAASLLLAATAAQASPAA